MYYFVMFLLFFIISFLSSVHLGGSFQPSKNCINCQFYLLKDNNPFYWNLETNPTYGKCSLFPKIEEDIDKEKKRNEILVVGEEKMNKLDFTFCTTARSFEDMCGNEGRFYKEKKISKKRKCFFKVKKMLKEYFEDN